MFCTSSKTRIKTDVLLFHQTKLTYFRKSLFSQVHILIECYIICLYSFTISPFVVDITIICPLVCVAVVTIIHSDIQMNVNDVICPNIAPLVLPLLTSSSPIADFN